MVKLALEVGPRCLLLSIRFSRLGLVELKLALEIIYSSLEDDLMREQFLDFLVVLYIDLLEMLTLVALD